MARIRNVLVDNTIGSIFRNVQSVSQATAENVIAGNRLVTKSISGGVVALKPIQNLGYKGLFFIASSRITKLRFSLRSAPKGSGVSIQVRKGVTYATSTTVDSPRAIPVNTVLAAYDVGITLAAGESLFFDIVSVGSMSPGVGLMITVGYYSE